MKKKSISMAFAVLSATVFLCSQTCWAEKAYITDAADAQIRSGPSSKNKVVGTLPLGSTVEILKGCEWTLIRYGTPSGENRDGWILSRSVGPRPPVETVARQLESENEALGQRLGESEKQNAALIDKEKQLTDKIRKLESDYEALKSGSANYVKLKEEYDSVKENLVAAQESIQMLNKESESLRLSQRIKWFAAGAAVLAFGLFLGWITGRQQKKRRSNYYM